MFCQAVLCSSDNALIFLMAYASRVLFNVRFFLLCFVGFNRLNERVESGQRGLFLRHVSVLLD